MTVTQKIFHTNNLESVGLSALTMHMFVDKNGNGTFDPGEQTINYVDLNLGTAAFIEKGDSGITLIRRLLPYTRYNIDIVESSISNPLWVPKAYTFSAITEPNIYKPVDVPFYCNRGAGWIRTNADRQYVRSCAGYRGSMFVNQR